MVIFNSYVKLPEGTIFCPKFHRFSRCHASGKPRSASRLHVWHRRQMKPYIIPRSEWGFSSDIYVYIYISYNTYIYIYYIIYIYYTIYYTYILYRYVYIHRERESQMSREIFSWSSTMGISVEKMRSENSLGPPWPTRVSFGSIGSDGAQKLQMGCFYLAINRIANAV